MCSVRQVLHARARLLMKGYFPWPVTGCIDPGALDRLNPDDAGGQYDSSGGSSGIGNPAGSVCEG